jgi:CBS domain-containing protein
MNAADIIDQYRRGIPAIVQSTMIVDVCAYLRSCKSPGTLVLSDRGDMKGILSQRDIIHASGRLGSSVMQMTAGELVREMVPTCDAQTPVTKILDILSNTGSDFALVTENTTIKGIVTLSDTMELLLSALSASDEPSDEASPQVPEPVAATDPTAGQQAVQHPVASQQTLEVAQTREMTAPPSVEPDQQMAQPAPLPAQPEAQPMQQPIVPQVPPAAQQVPDVPPAAAFAQQTPQAAPEIVQPQAEPNVQSPVAQPEAQPAAAIQAAAPVQPAVVSYSA